MSQGRPPVPDSMRDHWWWRPGWAPGRSFFTWHVTFADQPGLRPLADSYRPMLTALPMVDAVPIQWLHLTMQGIGFTDEVNRADIDAIVDAARHRTAALTPFTVHIGPAHVDPEGILMPAQPVEPLRRLRAAIRDAIADVWGADRVPEPADDWWPHVTLAYSNTAGPVEPIVEALTVQEPRTTDVLVSAVSLIDINRDNKAYEWADVATVRLGPGLGSSERRRVVG